MIKNTMIKNTMIRNTMMKNTMIGRHSFEISQALIKIIFKVFR